MIRFFPFLLTAVTLGALVNFTPARLAAQECEECHVCDNPQERYVDSEGASTIRVPAQYHSMECIYEDGCPPQGACGGEEEEEEAPEVAVAEFLEGLRQMNVKATEVFAGRPLRKVAPGRSLLAKNLCGKKVALLPKFDDLIRIADE